MEGMAAGRAMQADFSVTDCSSLCGSGTRDNDLKQEQAAIHSLASGDLWNSTTSLHDTITLAYCMTENKTNKQ